MADSNIGALPQAAQLDDASLLVAEQQGKAVSVTGAQFKEFGRQAVIGQVQGYVDEARQAAEEAEHAASAVTGMAVEAQASQTASVTKSTRDGKVLLTFGLPRGEKGEEGPEGKTGPRGPQGVPGTGLNILGYYDSLDALNAAVPSPSVGDAYGIGTEAPYSIYVFDSVTLAWKDNGPLSGGGGSAILPENVVISEGGAELEIPDTFGDVPHIITFDEEEDAPLSAEDIAYGEASVGEALEKLFTCVSDGKARIASAVTDKGIPTAQDASFAELAEHIGQITTGADTGDATASPGDILAGKTAYTASGKTEGLIPSLGAKTYTPGTAAQTIANGQYLSGTQTIKGDPNLTSSNIRKGVSIFGVAGAVAQNFSATLTVTADVGAVVTATHSGGTSVEALSTTGSVALNLPLEGQWTVTARRGVAQYNAVVINVSSRYTATLTAEVHIVRYGTAEAMSEKRAYFAGTTVGGYALFGGGKNDDSTFDLVESYDKNLVRKTETSLEYKRSYLAALTIGNHALFAGGYNNDTNQNYYEVDKYDSNLVHGTASSLSQGTHNCAAAVIGNYGLFAGGDGGSMGLGSTSKPFADVDTFDKALIKGKADQLLTASSPIAASNDSYALFYGGSRITAYDQSLTRSTATNPSCSPFAATRAGSYIIFFGQTACEAYDLFLTKVSVEALEAERYACGMASLKNHAIIAGGASWGDNKAVHHGEVDVYDSALVHTTVDDLGTKRGSMIGATVENFAVFAGGQSSHPGAVLVYYNTVDAYQYV